MQISFIFVLTCFCFRSKSIISSPSTPKDKFFERVINPYLAEVLQHPQSIEMRDGVMHIHNVEGPRRTGSVETKLEAVEQQVFKCQGMVEHGLNANQMMITEFTNNHKLDAKSLGRPSSSFKRKSRVPKPRSMTCKTRTVSMNIDSRG